MKVRSTRGSSRARTRDRGAWILVVAAGAATVAALWGRRASSEASASGAAPVAEVANPARVMPPSRVVPATPLDPEMLSARALREALDQYRLDSVYPPTSHAYDDDNLDTFDAWNRPIPTELDLDDRPGQETAFRFRGDRHHVGFGEALTATLEVWPSANPRARLPVTFASAIVLARTGRTGVALRFRDDGVEGDVVAGDHVYTTRLAPSDHDELTQARQVRLQVNATAGEVSRLVTLDFTYTPRPLLDLDRVASAVRAGNLAIDLDVTVHEPGTYQVYADVLAADGAPLGWVETPWIGLTTGAGRIELALFGKVLRDRGVAGPYTVRGLRAQRRAEGDELEMWWSDPRSFPTAAFDLDELSAASWDGPERREAIATIERSIAEQEAAEAAERERRDGL